MDRFLMTFNNFLSQYTRHIFIFFVALFLAITFAHPSLLVTDEWITVNQLSQLHDGHQLIFNEGKYGISENGTLLKYFVEKNNYLAYPLLLALMSLPAYWLIDLFGNTFVFFILYLWTFLLISIALMLNIFFREYSCIGKIRWTNGLIITTFLLFCINLLFYRAFLVFGVDTFPEMIAIAFTNIVLFAFLAVMVYEICLTIFHDAGYAAFGTVVCISCSSFLFWTNFCKDHILIGFLFTGIVLMIVKYLHCRQFRYSAAAFFLTGLLAWARPEIGALVFITLGIMIIYWVISAKKESGLPARENLIILTPLFTLVGAIPFFINNYLFTKNFLVPAWILWKTDTSPAGSGINGSLSISPTTYDTLGSLTRLFLSTINIKTDTFLSDIYGVLLNPQSGSIGLLPLVPLFLVAIFLIPVFRTFLKPAFSKDERETIIVLILLSLGVFLAYIQGISGMNTSYGIAPDMRYMSPMYLSLNLLGLMALRKLPAVSNNPRNFVLGMGVVWVIVLPVSLIIMALFYPKPETWAMLFIFLNITVSLVIYLVLIIFLFFLMMNIIYKISPAPAKISLVILCALPFVWQIDATYLARLYGAGLGGYSFWIPVMLKFFSFLF
jgi:hypothetical protein